jgi:hypothetical protein
MLRLTSNVATKNETPTTTSDNPQALLDDSLHFDKIVHSVASIVMQRQGLSSLWHAVRVEYRCIQLVAVQSSN